MIDIEDKFNKDKKLDDNYINYLERKYAEFITISDLPSIYFNHNIDLTKLPKRIEILRDNFRDIVINKYNFVFNVNSYFNIGYLVSYLLDFYFEQCMASDEALENILYLDTNLVLDDFKKLMDVNVGVSKLSLSHNFETISRNIENAPYVIWNKFSLINSNYDRQKLYNILLTRMRRGLGNIFFIKNWQYVSANILDEDIFEVMNVNKRVVDFSRQKLIFREVQDKEEIKW